MATFYSSRRHNYQPIREDLDIQTIPFLEATRDSIVGLFDVIGPTAFALVKSDVNGNIHKLNLKYETNKEKFVTLGAMLDAEKLENTSWSKNSATDALLWLNRGLRFICYFIKNVLGTTEADVSLEGCMKEAYDTSLKQCHSWIVQKLTIVTFKALPYRKDFITSLSNGATEEQFTEELRVYQQLLEQHVLNIDKLFMDRDLDLTHS